MRFAIQLAEGARLGSGHCSTLYVNRNGVWSRLGRTGWVISWSFYAMMGLLCVFALPLYTTWALRGLLFLLISAWAVPFFHDHDCRVGGARHQTA